MSELLIQEISAFGDFAPTVPFADGIDKEALIHGDDDPMFVTLPIGRINAQSHNGRTYPQAAVEAIVNAINMQRNGGNKGHLRSQDRNTRFDLPVLQWVGALLHDNGKAYGKAYIPRYAQDVREYIKNVKAVRGRIATSIYGSAEMDGDVVTSLEIESIDLVDPNRAGVPDAVATPIITSEMKDIGDSIMPDEKSELIISELRADRNNTLKELAALKVQHEALQEQTKALPELEKLLETKDFVKRVTEMQEQITEMQEALALIAELKAEFGKDVKKAIAELREQRDDFKRKNMAHEAHRLITEQVTFAPARPIIANMIGMNWAEPEAKALPFKDSEELTEAIKTVLEQETVQEMVKAMVLKETGGRAYIGKDLPTKLEDTPENRKEARRQFGF